MKTEGILFTAENTVEVGQVELPALRSNELRVQTQLTCISPGTDLRVLAGKQQGDWRWPVIPGYSMVGEVIECGADVEGFLPGERVFCIGTQAASCDLLWGANIACGNVKEAHAVKIPDGLTLEAAVLGKLAAIAYHGCTRSRPQPQEAVAVVGLGPIGLFAALFHQECGAKVAVTDLSEARMAQAARLELEGFPAGQGIDVAFASVFPEGADVIVDCTGHPAVLQQCLELARALPWDDSWERGSRLLVQGSFAGAMELDYDLAFQREIRVLLTRDHQQRDLVSAFEWMQETSVPFGEILTEVRPFRQAPEAFNDLILNKDQFLTIGLDWRS